MLRSEVVELINGGRAWAFLGSGVSVDSGAPTWKMLADSFSDVQSPSTGLRVNTDKAFVKALAAGNFPKAFSRVEFLLGRDALEQGVRERFSDLRGPGQLLKTIADWPFRGYVTTNYDYLLEQALTDLGQMGGRQLATPKTKSERSVEMSTG